MKVSELMTMQIATCTPQTSLQEVARLMRDHDCGLIPVVQSEGSRKLVGVITDRDIVTHGLALGKNPLELTASDCMSTPVFTISPDARIEECCKLMEAHLVRRAPVVDSNGCCDIVSLADIARMAPAVETAEVVREVSECIGAERR
jgi:CBS domain-containing protein